MPLVKRSPKGSLVTWLLVLAIFALAFVGSIIALEMLVKWVTLTRIQNAAQEAVIVYARDLVKLRDNQLSIQNKKELTFPESGIKCTSDDDSGCTQLKASYKTKIKGAQNLEYLNASQVFLYNLYGQRLADPILVDNVEQHQCHANWDNTRFKKNPFSPKITDCAETAIGKISSPIMDLTWNFDAQEYGQGNCCPIGSTRDAQKDFCVTMIVRGRLDPRMSGGLPFIQGVDFIKVGNFNMVLRSVGDKMSVKESTGDDIASNLSAESVSVEEQPKACIPPPPTPIPILTPSALTTSALSTPTPVPTLSPPVLTPSPPVSTSSPPVLTSSPPVLTPSPPVLTPSPPVLTPTPPELPTPTPPPPCECPPSPLCAVTQISTVEQFDLAGTASCSATKCSRFVCIDPQPCPTAAKGRSCVGNTIVETYGVDRTSPTASCGQSTRTIQDCPNGCSNAVCNPPPPPPDCVYKIEVNILQDNTFISGVGGSAASYQNKDSTRRSTNSSCFEQILNSCADEFDEAQKRYDDYFQKNNGKHIDSRQATERVRSVIDDANGRCLSSYGGIGGSSVQVGISTSQFVWYLDNQCKPIALGTDSYNKKVQEQIANKYKSLKNYQDIVNFKYTNHIPKICDSTSYSYMQSPISLILSDESEQISASQFSLGEDKGWYQWKASASHPLLVYDPKHIGQITSPAQLFGNYTFNKSWSNGYEALATLDKNKDGKLTDKELRDLALWFDNNQDGISDKYEVKKLSEVGITALFFEPSSSDIETRDIKANIGYEREVCVTESLLTRTCHKEIGSSVDWYGAGPFETKEEAILGKKYLFGMGFSNIQKQFLR